MSKNKVTIHDIAKILNIDSSTVSRALNDSVRVKQKTKDKIVAKANELGYQRNLLASNLRKNRSNTIGVIVPRISRYFFSSAISGIEEVAFKAGYNVIICQSLEQLKRENKIAETLLSNRVDGVLVSISMETENYDCFKDLEKGGIPLVFFDRHCNIVGNNNVLIDDFQAGFDATEHLILNGCKSIAHLSGPQSLEIYKNRYEGYKAALKKHHIPLKKELVIVSRLMKEDGVNCAKALINLPYKIDGIFSANDTVAISAMQQLKKEGIKIPEDIAIVGFSNEPISAVIEPPLTTVDQQGTEMGKTAASLLLEQINKKQKAKTIVLKPKLIARESSKRGI